MEQALGSTDPPDKSERNSRQMCFGDKEDPMEKKRTAIFGVREKA